MIVYFQSDDNIKRFFGLFQSFSEKQSQAILSLFESARKLIQHLFKPRQKIKGEGKGERFYPEY